MKNNRWIVAFVAMVVVLVQVAQATESQYNIFMYLVRGPVRTNIVSSPAYDSWSTNIVKKLYQNRDLADEDVGYRLLTDYITQPAGVLSNETLHFVVRITGKNGAKVSLDMLRFRERTSDPANTLSNLYSLIGVQNLVYSPRAFGVNYGPGGARVSDAIDIIGGGSLPKDEIVFVGMQSKYYLYTDATVRAQIDGYVTNFTVNFKLTGACEIVSTNNDILGFAQRTLQIRGEPILPVLSINRFGTTNVMIGINMEDNRTAVISSKPRFHPSSPWTVEGTFNANDTFFRSVEDVSQKFFRAQLE